MVEDQSKEAWLYCLQWAEKIKKRFKSPLYIFAILISLGLFVSGFIFYLSQEKEARRTIQKQLQAIGELKAREINNWLQERLADASNLAESPFFATKAVHYFQKTDDELKARLLRRLKATAEAYGYDDIYLLDADKNVRLNLIIPSPALGQDCYELLALAARSQRPVLSDLHRDHLESPAHIEVATIISRYEREEKNRVDGFILFRVNAENFLFPLIQSWPLPSRTAETLLVRREGEEVVFLNECRHRSKTALSLRFPLNQKEKPEVWAALGETGFIEGEDYRGKKVLAYILPIPRTRWSMVAKIDVKEALGPWRTRSILIILVTLGILAFPVGLTEFLWQRREKVYYRQLYQAEARARESEDLFRILNESSLAGVYLIQDGLLRYVNQAAADLFGYTPEELIDKQSPLIAVHPKDRALVEENIRRRLAGEVKSLRYEFLGQRKDGSTLNVEVHGSLINYRGKPAIIGNLIDITERKKLFEEVQKRESELRSTLYSIGDGVIVTDTEGKIMMMNPVAERLTGWKEAEAKDKPVQEVFHIINEFTRQPIENPIIRVIREGIVVGLANHSVLINREGKEYPVVDSGAPIVGPEGKLIGVVLVFRDQTEQRQVQRALEKSEREKAAILDGMLEHVVYQAPDHTILWANRAAAQSLGKRPQDLVGHRCYELWHGRSTPCDICPVALARDTRQPQEDEIKTPDGRYWYIRGYPVIDEKGQAVAIIEVTLEITEKVKAQLDLKASEERYRRLAENAQDLIYRYRFYPQRGFEYVNPAATEITGYTPEEHYADPDLGYKIIVEEDRPRLQEIVEGKITQPIVLRWRRKDGEIIWTELRNVPIYDEEGRLVAIEGIARDVSERVRREEDLKKSLREKEILLREIHHRVKNNMQVISSLLNLQAALVDDPRMREIFRQCQKRIRSMAYVHEKLYGSQDLTAIDFADYLHSLAKSIYHEFQWQLGPIDLKFELEPLALNINQAVPLGLIANELITNCFKHAFPERRLGTIWVALKRLDEKRALLQIKDDGVGLPIELDLKKPKTMGLTIIEALVEQLEGKIEILREGGTDIRLVFPLP